MPNQTDIADRSTTSVRHFIHRTYRMRTLGTALCALPIASVLLERGVPAWVWVALSGNALVWPHLANQWSQRAADPLAAEYRNLVLDAAFGGLWLAMIAVSPLPTAIIVTALTTDRIAAGGWRMVRRSTVALLLAFAAGWAMLGFPFAPEMSLRTLLACLPLLFGYNVALSVVTYRLGKTISRQNRQLEHLNLTDASSNLPNRRHFDASAMRAHALFRRHVRPAALLLVDIDRFKDINDHYGHGTGDVVVKAVADVLRDAVCPSDVPARIGGDEFAVLLNDTGLPHAREIGERIRARIAALAFDAAPGLACTVSVGVADVRDQHDTLQHWMRDADAALYRAKAAGRNRLAAA
ncbi:diguanylate cyclase [Luteimonas sp. BDR2-5]|uniref:diguanylate cyclase n=1 Tax=Proluteimonas luteida TaxID=2878685 RepID=UPI001E3FEC49|nr:diguanylate cyclase [Luteimonas sp. BDR2-5]MCD9028331.1 diguanylate cyclase [Luteimonas sp. BDR2-5]